MGGRSRVLYRDQRVRRTGPAVEYSSKAEGPEELMQASFRLYGLGDM